MLTDEDPRALSEQAAVRSGACGFLAAALRYPDRETLALLDEPGRWSGWSETLARTDPGLGKLLGDLRSNLPSCRHDAQLAALQESHVVLFGHAVRGTWATGLKAGNGVPGIFGLKVMRSMEPSRCSYMRY